MLCQHKGLRRLAKIFPTAVKYCYGSIASFKHCIKWHVVTSPRHWGGSLGLHNKKAFAISQWLAARRAQRLRTVGKQARAIMWVLVSCFYLCSAECRERWIPQRCGLLRTAHAQDFSIPRETWRCERRWGLRSKNLFLQMGSWPATTCF